MGLRSGKQLGLIVLFTIVELVTLTLWLVILGVTITSSQVVMIEAAGVLFVGLLIEHAIAIIAGDFPARGAVKPQNGN